MRAPRHDRPNRVGIRSRPIRGVALASRESRRSTADEFVLRKHLEAVGSYDIALVDSPPSLGVLTLNALAAASHLVLVTEPSFLALRASTSCFRLATSSTFTTTAGLCSPA
jgi:cellulose biosynthesis protein BcsQ